MVSAQINAIVKFYRKTPSGTLDLLYSNHTKSLGPSGSSEGVIASTPEKWITIPAIRNKPLMPNDHLVVTATVETAATSDASDGAVVLPMTMVGGGSKIMGKLDGTADWDVKQFGDIALTVNETVICEATIREPLLLGHDKVPAFMSIENNA